MTHVLSLIAAPAKTTLGEADIDRARRAIDGPSGEPAWLSAGEACDIAFEDAPEAALRAARAAFDGRAIDVNVLPARSRRKRLLIADMDSTMIGQECIDELAEEVGLRDKVAAITERAMRGEIAFAPALRERVALLKGLPTSVVAKVIGERIVLTPGAKTLVATMRAKGAYTALVSGGFTDFVEAVGARIGFDEKRANRLIVEGGFFAGLVEEPVLGAEAKVQALDELSAGLSLKPEDTLAVGDGANDSAMIQRAGLGVGFRAKPALRQLADATLDHADLTGLLFLQGYRREEFVLETTPKKPSFSGEAKRRPENPGFGLRP